MTDNPVQNVTFPSNGGTAHGYLAVPPTGRGPLAWSRTVEFLRAKLG